MLDLPLVGTLQEGYRVCTEVLTVHGDDLSLQLLIVSCFVLKKVHWQALGARMHANSPRHVAVATRRFANIFALTMA